MAALNLQSLAWGDDGDLAVEDTLHLLTAVEEVMKEMSLATVESDS